MNEYMMPILIAFVTFPLVAFLITIPYMIIMYRKYGSISPLRTLIVYSLFLYLISAYYLVILPLPPINEVINYTSSIYQLIPFNFINDIMTNSSLVISDINTYLVALKESCIYNVLFNIVLFVPLGIYLRYYFKCDLKKTLLLSFLLSLFFELTQLTGLYFIYPRPYRLFDVDDLIMNSLGGCIGYLITPIFNLILPSRDKIDETSYIRGKKVGILRRIMALLIDFIIISILTIIINLLFLDNLLIDFILITFLYFILSTIITKGYTLGKYIVKIKVVSKNDNTMFYQYIFRYIMLYIILFIPIYCIYISNNNLSVILSIILWIVYIIFIVIMCYKILNKKELYYEKFSHTKHISTIMINNEIDEENN